MGRRVGRRGGGSYRGKHVWVRRKARVGCWNSEVPLLRIRIVFWQCCNLSKKASKKLLKKNKNKVDTCCTSPVMGPFPHSLCHMSGGSCPYCRRFLWKCRGFLWKDRANFRRPGSQYFENCNWLPCTWTQSMTKPYHFSFTLKYAPSS